MVDINQVRRALAKARTKPLMPHIPKLPKVTMPRVPRGPTIRWDIDYDKLFKNRRKK